MDNHWAIEQLQVIRTLMERSAVYRRALAPIMTYAGAVGILAALGGAWRAGGTLREFVAYWMCVAAVAAVGAFLLVRRQALRAAEPFWSLPTRRVGQALFPPFLAGLVLSLGMWVHPPAGHFKVVWLPGWWMLLYAFGLHSAGFFMARGIKLFSWAFLLCGCAVLAGAELFQTADSVRSGHWLMGLSFGGLHLACGIYLYFTEKGGAAS
jgi:hypothetical protein